MSARLNELTINGLKAPTTANGTTYGYGTSGQVLKTDGDSVYWGNDNNTTYGVATSSSNGLMPSGDKAKSDRIKVSGIDYGTTLPSNPVVGQMFLIESDGNDGGGGASTDILHCGANEPTSNETLVWLDTDDDTYTEDSYITKSKIANAGNIWGSTNLNGMVASAEAVKTIPKFEKLWTNSQYLVRFSEQTIPLSLNSDDLLIIKTRSGINDTYVDIKYQICDFETKLLTSEIMHANLDGYNVLFAYRTISINANGITFGVGKYKAFNSPNPTTTNDYLIPVAIYVLRHAR